MFIIIASIFGYIFFFKGDSSKMLIVAANDGVPGVVMKGNGIEYDLVKRVANNVKKEIKIDPLAFDKVIQSVKSGKAVMGIAGFSRTDEEILAFEKANPELVFIKHSPAHIFTVSKSSAKEKIYGVQAGTENYNLLKAFLGAAFDKQAKVYSSVDAMMKSLEDGIVNTIVIDGFDRASVQEIFKKDASLIVTIFGKSKSNYCVIINAKHVDVIKAVHEVLKDLRKPVSMPKAEIAQKGK